MWDLKKEEGIFEAISAVIDQDDAFYPGTTRAKRVGALNAGPKYLWRRYRWGSEELSLGGLFGRLRSARELRSDDTKSLSQVALIAEIKHRFGGLRYADEDELRRYTQERALDPVMALLAEAPAQLNDFLSLFYGDELSEPEIAHLVRTFSGLKLYTEIHEPHSPSKDIETLMAAMFTRRHRLEELKDKDFDRALKIFKYLLGRHFESNAAGTARMLHEVVARNEHPTIRRLVENLIEHYTQGRDYAVAGVRTELFLYQKIGAKYLVEHDRAILADDPGMGKTLTALAAAETLRAQGKVKKVLIVTPAGIKTSWREEIARHLVKQDTFPLPIIPSREGRGDNRPRKVVSIHGSTEVKRRQVLDAYDADYILVNYEFLRGKSQAELAPLLQGVDLIIADEAQRISNPSDTVQQAEAVRKINAPRRWLLTATPYYSHPENIYALLAYLHPEKYSSFKEFKETYSADVTGLKLLHAELDDVMIRRRRAEALGEYEAGVPLETQGVRLPRKVILPVDEEGAYEISHAQVELLRELSQDIRGWMVRHTHTKKMTHFTHLKLLYQAIVDPKFLGEDIASPLYEALDKIVMKRLAQGKKVLIYAHHRSLVSRLQERYAHLGAVKYNSTLSMRQREENLRSYETDPHVRIMVAGIHSGGVGLNIKAADTVIYAERSFDHSAKLQSEGRPQRIDVERKKESFEVISLVGRYPKDMVESETDARFRAFMRQGTVAEILEGRLNDLDHVYRLVMDGIVSEDEASRDAMRMLVQGFAGLTKVEDSALEGVRRKEAQRAAGAFFRLWDTFKDDSDIRKGIERLAGLYLTTDVAPRELAQALGEVSLMADDLSWLATPFAESNKALRAQAV